MPLIKYHFWQRVKKFVFYKKEIYECSKFISVRSSSVPSIELRGEKTLEEMSATLLAIKSVSVANVASISINVVKKVGEMHPSLSIASSPFEVWAGNSWEEL